MFIVHSIGSDEEEPCKIFTAKNEARKDAEAKAKGDVERVFVYEWDGDLEQGLAAAKEGRLEPLMHYPHHEEARIAPPEAPIRLSKRSQVLLEELVKKMPKVARKF